MYVAVVCRGVKAPLSGGTNGGWSCFAGHNKDEVVERALVHARSRNENVPQSRRVTVLVGELTHEAKLPLSFTLVELPPKDNVVDVEASLKA